MRNYELTLIIDPELSPAKQKALTEKIKKFITELKGETAEFTTWGKKPLAYPIRKRQVGVYFFALLTLPSTGPAKLNQFLHTEENLLRYLLVGVNTPKAKTAPKTETKALPKTKKVTRSKVKKS